MTSSVGSTHRPGQIRAEFAAAGFATVDVVAVEGPAFLLGRLDDARTAR